MFERSVAIFCSFWMQVYIVVFVMNINKYQDNLSLSETISLFLKALEMLEVWMQSAGGCSKWFHPLLLSLLLSLRGPFDFAFLSYCEIYECFNKTIVDKCFKSRHNVDKNTHKRVPLCSRLDLTKERWI